MKNRRSGRWAAAAAALMLALAALPAALPAARAESGAGIGMYDPCGNDGIQVNWRDLHIAKNVKLPVYSAPFEDSWRGAKGKAAVSARETFTLLGTVEDGTWGLADYAVDRRSRRLGWIRIPEEAGRLFSYGDLPMYRKLLRVTRKIPLTDDPKSGSRTIRTLQAGEQVIGMFLYGEKQICVETQHEGKTVWGLIPASAAEDATDTLIHMEGDTCTIPEGVTLLGGMQAYRTNPEDPEQDRMVTRVRPGDLQIRNLDLYTLGQAGIRKLRLPESLRWIGSEGISMGSLEELRLAGGTEFSPDAFYSVRIDRMILGKEYRGGIPEGEYLGVREWKVEEGNPLYCDMDGVLYSADRKVLMRYPSRSPAEHYDVPAGTEEIRERAFSDDGTEIRLKSLSLPIGLKKIGEYAFADCGYLLSLTVPLTVRELAPNAFRNCVSLERLSLPDGMTAELGDWVKKEDFSAGAFRGDNWATYDKPAEKEAWELEYGESFRMYPVRLDNAEGQGTVTVYADAEGSGTLEPERVGKSLEYVEGIRNGRALLREGRWVALENLRSEAMEIFFEITDAEPADPARRTEDGAKLQFSGLEDGEAFFFVSHVLEDGMWEEKAFRFPVRETLLYRERTGGTERLGILVPEGDSAEMTEADGTRIGHLYFGTQAKVLEEAGDRVRVETAYGTGWVARDELQMVEEEP